MRYPSRRNSGRSPTPSPATPSRNTTPPGSSAAASTTTRRSPSSIAWLTTWNNPGALRHEPTPSSAQLATVPKFNLPLKIPFLAHTAFKNNAQKRISKLIRHHRHTLIPYHLPTKTIQELPHPALNKVLWNHMRKVTTQGRHWKPEPCKCHEFLLEHPRAEQHQGHVATGLETLDFCKGQSNLGAAFNNVGACNAFFPSKRRLHAQTLDQFRRWLKHHLFPNDDRILESFERFFEEQWQQHKEQQRHEPRLTHRLIKHLLSAPPTTTSFTTRTTPTPTS